MASQQQQLREFLADVPAGATALGYYRKPTNEWVEIWNVWQGYSGKSLPGDEVHLIVRRATISYVEVPIVLARRA